MAAGYCLLSILLSSDTIPMADSRMRVAVAGTNELALLIAAFIISDTSHQLIILSRSSQPNLPPDRFPVHVVDYDSQESLQHAVMGVDTIISTMTGPAQLELLKAAVEVGVRRFAPAEFEGQPEARQSPDPLDRGKSNIRGWLDYYRSRIESTVFSCGVLYERFAPGGLRNSRIALNIPYGDEGDYLINVRNLMVSIPQNGDTITVAMTAAYDVARLVVRALSMDRWPRQLSMVGEKLTVRDIIKTVLRVRGRSRPHSQSRIWSLDELAYEVAEGQASGDMGRQIRAEEHIATAQGRYNFHGRGNLREQNRDCKMIKFEAWLEHQWSSEPEVEDE